MAAFAATIKRIRLRVRSVAGIGEDATDGRRAFFDGRDDPGRRGGGGFADEGGDELRKDADHPARAIEPLLPEARVECRHFDLAPAARRVDEAVVAEIDADVREGEAAGVEEHEVARLQVARRHLLADLAHVSRRPRQGHAGHLLEHIADEPAAIESGLGRVAAPLVADADQVERGSGEVLRGVEGACRRVLHRRGRGRGERARADILSEDGRCENGEAAGKKGKGEPAAKRVGGAHGRHCPRFGDARQPTVWGRYIGTGGNGGGIVPGTAGAGPGRRGRIQRRFRAIARARRARAAFGSTSSGRVSSTRSPSASGASPRARRPKIANPSSPGSSPCWASSPDRSTASATVAPGGSSTGTTSWTRAVAQTTVTFTGASRRSLRRGGRTHRRTCSRCG